MIARPGGPVLVAVLLGLSACYRYVPVPTAAPPPEPGDDVRVQFTAPRPLELGTVTVHDVAVVEGDVYRAEADALAVYSRWLYTSFGHRHETNGAVYFLPPGDMRAVEVRRLQPVQTALTAALLAGGAVALFDMALRTFGGGGTPTGDGDTDNFRVAAPLLLLRLPVR